MLVPVILSGFLAKRFGKRFDLAVSSPREAMRALCVQLHGFEQAILNYPHGFKVWIDRENITETDLNRYTGALPIRIVPVIAGAKSGLANIVTGYVLVGVGMVTGMPFITSMGVSMMLGGVSQLLFSPPKPLQSANGQSNLLFSGAVNTATQGASIPVVYGRMRIGSQVISAGIESVQLPYYAAQATSAPTLSQGGGGK